MKALFRFFLSLCILLLCGYGHNYASSSRGHYPLPTAAYAEKNTAFGQIQNAPAADIHCAPASTGKGNQKTYIAEDEEETEDEKDESALARKPANAGACFAYLHAHTSQGLRSRIDKRLPSGRHFLCATSATYILFRVIRV